MPPQQASPVHLRPAKTKRRTTLGDASAERTITVLDGNGENPTQLTREQYEALKSIGMLWEFHPHAPAEWPEDAALAGADDLLAAAVNLDDGAGSGSALPDLRESLAAVLKDWGTRKYTSVAEADNALLNDLFAAADRARPTYGVLAARHCQDVETIAAMKEEAAVLRARAIASERLKPELAELRAQQRMSRAQD